MSFIADIFPCLKEVADEPRLRRRGSGVKEHTPNNPIVIRKEGDIPNYGRIYTKTIGGDRYTVWDMEYRHALAFRDIGKCSQSESNEHGIKVYMPYLIIKRAFIDGSPDGLASYANNVFWWSLVLESICEDGINLKRGADYNLIYRCDFARARDKVVQINDARNVWVVENKFRKCDTAVKALRAGVKAYNNRYWNARQVYVADGSRAQVEYAPRSESYNAIGERRTSAENGGDIDKRTNLKMPFVRR